MNRAEAWDRYARVLDGAEIANRRPSMQNEPTTAQTRDLANDMCKKLTETQIALAMCLRGASATWTLKEDEKHIITECNEKITAILERIEQYRDNL